MLKFYLITFVSLITCLVLVNFSQAQNVYYVSTDISADQHWTTEYDWYEIDPTSGYNITVSGTGTELTIDPDVIVKFNPQTSIIFLDGTTLDINGTSGSHVTFEGTNPGAGYWKQIYFAEGSNSTIDYLDLSDAGYSFASAIYLAADGDLRAHVQIANSIIENCLGCGIGGTVGTTSWDYKALLEAVSCTISNCGEYGIFIPHFDENTKVQYCIIEGCQTGIMLEGVYTEDVIRNNTIEIDDESGTGMYIASGDGSDGRICNNLIILCEDYDRGIASDAGAGSEAEIFNNVVIGNSSVDQVGFEISSTENLADVANNIVNNCDTGFSGSGGTIDYNLAYGYSSSNHFVNFGTIGGNCLTSDPQFVDAPNGDCHLLYNSPCINAGSNDAGTDPYGSPPDMGIYGGTYAWDPFYAVIPALSMDQNEEILWDTYLVSDYITTNAYTLTIDPGADLMFDTDCGITVSSNGTIDAEGVSGNRITFRNFDEEDYWDGITLCSGSSTGSIIRYCDFTRAIEGLQIASVDLTHSVRRCTFTDCDETSSSYGIKLHTSDTDVDSCYFTNCYTGIDMYESESHIYRDTLIVDHFGINIYGESDWKLEENVLYHSVTGNYGIYINEGSGILDSNKIAGVYNGIKLVDCAPKLQYNLIDTCYNIGLWLTAGSQPIMSFAGIGQDGANRIADCDSNEIFINGYLYPLINTGHNDFVPDLDECEYIIYSDDDEVVYAYNAQYNWWSDAFSTAADIRDHIYPTPDDNPDYEINVSPFDEDSNTNYTSSVEEDLLYEGLAYELSGEYEDAYEAYCEVVEVFPDVPEAITAFTRMFCCTDAMDGSFTDLLDDYEEFEEGISNESNLFYLKRMEGRALRKMDEFNDALDLYGGLIQNVSNITDSVFVLVDIENTLFESGVSGINSIGQNPVAADANSAHRQKVEDLLSLLNGGNQNNPDAAPEIVSPLSYKLVNVYPNPFNAIAKINYKVQQLSKVEIKVFGLTGQEICTVEDGFKCPGEFSAFWNAEQFASGVYFIKVSVIPQDNSKSLTSVDKVVLMK